MNYPARQHFKMTKFLNEEQVQHLRAYLESLFDKTHLVADGLMTVHEQLEFDITSYTQGVSKKPLHDAYFSVAVSGRALTDALFKVIVERFNSATHELYVIGEPGSGDRNRMR
ncbi:hypothetical protein [Pseudomonas viridiflava]|uniref:hypothetical protein n=1 Tax=Pseudomonas viridiflava TaxID=33069 RepID=UPI002EAE52EB|nr:hypothetical protein [Pseudomonas viridiflava]MEE3929829.1 hypothetical protein [Pseudomonas viridiflava]MEE3941014.1 hypothetical protein [Pseudomonas viridiflava]MEE3967024.1 hypothetical protein [Pseudomonas viridiflava]MEE3980202.1 hypothetical protein [Pseudomonas viridiflava]